MRVLITGGAGFIGSHLAERHLSLGDEVYIIDNLDTGSLENLQSIKKQYEKSAPRFFPTIDSVLNREVMLELIGTCDVVYHLAAAVGVQYILDNPLSSIVTNIQGTEMILELCAKFKKKVIIASTSEVYGKHDHAPLSETDDCVYGPSTKSRWSYAAAKLMDEFTALAYHRAKNLPVIIVRLFNTVGPRQTGRYGMVIPRLVNQALQNEPITVYGNGCQTRTFTHVREVVECLTKLIKTPYAVGHVLNIGGIQEISILDLAKKIKHLTRSKSEICLVPYEKAFPSNFEDMQRRVPSTEKLRQTIGMAPSLTIDEILNDVITFFQNQMNEESFQSSSQ